jgi:hypothetical protein
MKVITKASEFNSASIPEVRSLDAKAGSILRLDVYSSVYSSFRVLRGLLLAEHKR